jgi:hypothetical protein
MGDSFSAARCRKCFGRDSPGRMAAGGRHPVHLDAEILEDEWPDPAEFELDLGVPSLAVDTTRGYEPDLDSVVRFIA